MSSAQDRDGLEAWHVLMATQGVLLSALDRDLAEEGAVPLAWFELLSLLAQAPAGAMRMQDLAHHLQLSKSGGTRLADRLEGAGLIERRRCEEDARGTFATLTAEGRRALRYARPRVLRAVEEHFARHLSENEASAVRRTLSKVLDAHGYPRHPFGGDVDEEASA